MTTRRKRSAGGREEVLYLNQYHALLRRTHRMFAWVMVAQWVAAITAALAISPLTWIGKTGQVHQHVVMAVVLGGILSGFSIFLALRAPERALTRHIIAASQMMYSALLIHITGGRIETHFHVFGSLAFLAFYRDWRVLITATVVVAGDHFVRGVYLPLSVFGTPDASQWRWVEHAAWVVFEDIVLVAGCVQATKEMRRNAADRAGLEFARDRVETEVLERTAELSHTATMLRARETELRAAIDLAESANRAKSEFLANMSHEIRTPMTAILGYAELIMDPSQSPEDRIEAVQVIRRNGEHLLSLLNDILDLSKIEAGKMTIESIECSPVQICEEVYSLMQIRAASKGVRLRLEYDPSLSLIVSDPLRLRQVLVNLVGNAIKFTEQGEVVVSASIDPPSKEDGERAPADLEAGAVDDEASDMRTIRFAVKDSGIGMTTEQIARLFQPFAQADTSTTRRFGGSGLGLLICRRFLHLLGGDVSVESEAGVGSVFTVSLAAKVLKGTEATRKATPIRWSRTVPNSLVGRILLAEDGADNQRLVSLHLRRAGAEVVIAGNGQEAVNTALQSVREGRPFDLIFMDMQMPILDGYGAASLLRQKGWTQPIIALTAHAMSGDRERCLQAGCDDYMTKPIDRTRLVGTAGEWLNHSRGLVDEAA